MTNHVLDVNEAARPEGLEPSTYGLEIRCSIRLSYGRIQWVIGETK